MEDSLKLESINKTIKVLFLELLSNKLYLSVTSEISFFNSFILVLFFKYPVK